VSISADLRQQVCQRANCACEFYGQLIGLTTVGTFTIGHLRLNRSQLIAYRQNRRRQSEAQQLLVRHQDVIASLDYLNDQLAGVVHEQKQLLLQQQRLIRVLLQQRHRS
jgi:hypothetical protein